ncbi:hypothetical protein GGR57DRAFT_354410 [Xylariaceae sp. FL1272]|nr:hypothetical protein GGR57DRAFT_354410 [Xylariaceae sp. FL1272]
MIVKAKNPDQQQRCDALYTLLEKNWERGSFYAQNTKIERAREQRRFETNKSKTKASSFAPYQESSKFTSFDNERSKQAEAVDHGFSEAVLTFSALVTGGQPAAVSDTQVDQKVGQQLEMQEQELKAHDLQIKEQGRKTSDQDEQIQKLLETNEQYRKQMASFEENFKSFQSTQEAMRLGIEAIKSENDALKVDVQNLKSENQGLNKQLQDVVTKAENAAPLADLARVQSECADLQSRMERYADSETWYKEKFVTIGGTLKTIEVALATITDDFPDIKSWVEEVDKRTLNEICEAWTAFGPNLKAVYEEHVEQRNSPTVPSIEAKVEQLQKDVKLFQTTKGDVLPVPRASPSTASNESTESLWNARITQFQDHMLETMRSHSGQVEDVLGHMIDQHGERINVLEQHRAETVRSDLSARVEKLEKIDDSRRVYVGSLSERLGDISQKQNEMFGDIAAVLKRFQNLQNGSLGPASDAAQQEKLDRLQQMVTELQKTTGRIDHTVLVMNSQWSNINTKDMAVQMIQHLNPFFDKICPLEKTVRDLEKKQDTIIKQISPLSEIMHSFGPAEKRTASPGHLGPDEPAKKRKLDTNGLSLPPLNQRRGSSHALSRP